MNVLEMLNDVSLTRGTKAKMAKIKNYGEACPAFKATLLWALDPHRVYRIKKLPNESELQDMGEGSAKALIGFDVLQGLMKKSGLTDLDKAEVHKHIKRIEPHNRVVFCRILKKDLRIGVDAATINKIWPNYIPEYKCGLAQTFKPEKARWPMFIEVKYDGERCQIFIDGDDIQMSSRNGKPILGYEHIRKQLLAIPHAVRNEGIVLDGELMFGMFGKDTRKKSEKTADYIVYDLLTLDEWNAQTCSRPFKERRATMFNLIGNMESKKIPNLRISHGIYCYTVNDAMGFYDRVIADGGEGIMLKLPDAPYHFKRGYHWMKYKPILDVDLKIIDVQEGTGKYEGCLGAIVVDFNGVAVNVGSGFCDEDRLDLWLAYEKKKSSLIGKIAEIRYTEVTPDGSLRFPRFVKLRHDKG